MTIPEIRDFFLNFPGSREFPGFIKLIFFNHLDRKTRGHNPYTCKMRDSQQIQVIYTFIQIIIVHLIENPHRRMSENIHIHL